MKFKVGDKITHKNGLGISTPIISIKEDQYYVRVLDYTFPVGMKYTEEHFVLAIDANDILKDLCSR